MVLFALASALNAAAAPAWLTDPALPIPRTAVKVDGERVRALVRADGDVLVARGIQVRRRSDGAFRGGLGLVSVEADRRALATLQRQGFEVFEDRRIDLGPLPTNVTGKLVGAPAIRARQDGPTGAGVVVGNIDSHIEVTHPHFFRADAGSYEWLDVDGDGELTPGVDGLDLDRDGRIAPHEALEEIDGFTYRWDPLTESLEVDDDPGTLKPWRDYLFLDVNGDGFRDAGRPDWTDTDPGMGEPTFVPDDVDGDGVIEPGERVWQLGSSIIRAVYWDGEIFLRGEHLTQYDRRIEDDRSHGTAVSGIVAGGQLPNQRRFAGLAPDAELVFISRYTVVSVADLLDFIEVAEAFEVDVLLHEYAPWLGYALDGSGLIEQAVDRLAEDGMVQVCAAGNLADARKHAVLSRGSGKEMETRVQLSDEAVSLWLEWHYTDPADPPVCTIESPDFSFRLTEPGQVSQNGHWAWLDWQFSPAGNGRSTLAIWRDDNGVLADHEWSVRCETDQPLDIYLIDGSGWDRGSVFTRPDRSKTMGLPATAEHCIAVGAYSGRFGYEQEVGDLRTWSSRGPALWGQKTIDLTAPDDAYAPAAWFVPGSEGAYQLFGGTSGAAPHVAAIAALMKEVEPDLDGVEARARLVASAQSTGGREDAWGAGRMDGYAALYADTPGEIPSSVELTTRWFLGASGPEVLVEGADDLRWDFGYDGVIDATGPRQAVGYGDVVRIDAYRDGYRVGGLVLDGAPTLPPEEKRGCDAVQRSGFGWDALWSLVGRRR